LANLLSCDRTTRQRSPCDNHKAIGRLVRRIPAAVERRSARRMNSPLPGEARRVHMLCESRVLAAQAVSGMPNVWVAMAHGSPQATTCVGANSFAGRITSRPRGRCDNHKAIGRLVRRIPVVVGTRGARRMNSPLLKPATYSNRRLGINA